MLAANAHAYQELLNNSPNPFTHQFFELLNRQQNGIEETKSDKEFKQFIENSGLKDDQLQFLLQRYGELPTTIKRSLAGCSWENKIPTDASVSQLLNWSYTENYIYQITRNNIADSSLKLNFLRKQNSESKGSEDASDKIPLIFLPNKFRNVHNVEYKNGVVVGVEDDNFYDEKASGHEWDWELTGLKCYEPVFGNDYVIALSRYQDSRGNQKIEYIPPTGSYWWFWTGKKRDIEHSVYSGDPGNSLDIYIDFWEIDNIDVLVEVMEGLTEAIGTITGILDLNTPEVNAGKAAFSFLTNLIRIISKNSAYLLGQVSENYATKQIMEDRKNEHEYERDDLESPGQLIGYDWNYEAKYILRKK